MFRSRGKDDDFDDVLVRHWFIPNLTQGSVSLGFTKIFLEFVEYLKY